MKKRMKKAFTLVELLVVIAILAVLATVTVVGYNSFTEKARISNDKTLVTQLNKLLQADEAADGKAKFAHDALAVVAENGFDVKKMTPTTDDYDIIWNEESNRFVLLDNKGAEVIETLSSKAHLNWQFSSDTTPVKEGFSIYLNDKFTGTEVTVSSGLDVGSHTGIETINYVTNDTEEVTFRTNGGTLNIDAPNATVNHYGSAVVVNVNDVASSTYNLFGEAQFVKVADGEHVVLKSGSTVNTVYVAGTNNKVEAQNGQTGNVYTSADGTEEDIKTSGTLFAGGLGTEASPYLIDSVETMLNIGKMCEYDEPTGTYSSYKYYKVKDGVKEIDCEGNTINVNLCGSFDGNGVTFKNLNSGIFNKTIGETGVASEGSVVIKNFVVNFGRMNENGVVHYNLARNLTLENIDVHGFIENENNFASFIDFAGKNNESEVHVTFKNCNSDATIVYTSGNGSGFIGHPYSNSNSTFNFNNSTYTGNIYASTGSAKKYFSNWFNGKAFVDGVEVDGNSVKHDAAKTFKINVENKALPSKYETFTTSLVDGFDHAVAMLIIGPNGNGTTHKGGYYCAVYMSESDSLIINESSISTSSIKYFDITSNGNSTTETGVSSDGKTFNIVNDAYNNEIGGASVKIIQYDALGNILKITDWKII